jgi:hypothetical protein
VGRDRGRPCRDRTSVAGAGTLVQPALAVRRRRIVAWLHGAAVYGHATFFLLAQAFATVLEGVACLLWMLALGASPLPVPLPVMSEPTPMAATPVLTVSAEIQPEVTVNAESHVDGTVSRESASHSHDGTTPNRAPRDDPPTPLRDVGSSDDDVTRLIRDIAAGHVRPTVADIRRHLGCSQGKATALRRQLVELRP